MTSGMPIGADAGRGSFQSFQQLVSCAILEERLAEGVVFGTIAFLVGMLSLMSGLATNVFSRCVSSEPLVSLDAAVSRALSPIFALPAYRQACRNCEVARCF